MKILAIRIKNLASLEGITEIDFTQEPLCSAGIFAITGPMGAGKSTILDALCLALYAKTPRYLQAKESGVEIYDVIGSTISQGDVRGILRDGTADGFAEVDFVGIDGQKYKAIWSVRRARNKVEGSIQSDTVELKNLTTNIDFPGRKNEITKEIERLVGLNFEQFTRSVLLAQGDFTAFLKANKDEKSSLLEKLTGTHIYSEISKRIFEKSKATEQDLRLLKSKMEGILTLTGDEIKHYQEEQNRYTQDIINFEKEIEGLSAEIKWHQTLAELQSANKQAEDEWGQSVTINDQSAERRLILKQIDQVQGLRTWVDARAGDTEQQRQKSHDLKTLEETMKGLLLEKDRLKNLLLEATATLGAKKSDKENANVLLEQAKKLDTILNEKNIQTESARLESEEADEKYQQNESQLKIKQESAVSLSADIETIQQWKSDNKSKEDVAGNISLITSKLIEAENLLKIFDQKTVAIQNAKNKIDGFVTTKKSVTVQFEIKNEEYRVAKQLLESGQKELLSTSIHALEQSKNGIDASLEDAISGQAHWKILYNTVLDFEALSKKYKTNQLRLIAENEDLAKIKPLLAASKTAKETSAKLLSNAKLQASENVETLRSHLVNNEPCPVCGSHAHPFVAENPMLDLILSGLEDTHLENEGLYDEFLNKLANAQQAINGMEHTIQQLGKEITVKNESCQKLEQTWKEFKIFKDCNIIADNEKQTWLENKIKLFKADQSAVQIKISNYYTALQKQEQQQTVVTQLEKDITAFTNTLKDIERNRQTEEGDLFRLKGEVEQCNADIKLVEQLMTPYFQTSDWIASWKKDTKTFAERITSFANKWKNNTAKLETDKKGFAVLSAVIKGLEDSEKVLLKDTEKKAKILSDLKNSLELLKTKRKSIFDGIEVDVVEARFKQAIDKAEENLNGLNTENNEVIKKSTISATQKEQCVKEMARLAKSVSGYSSQIETWIATYNTQNERSINEEQAIGLLHYSYDQIHAERNALKVIADAVTKTLSVLGERKKLLNQHEERKASERDLEAVNNLYVIVKEECEAITKLRNDIAFKLQQDIENKEKVGHLLVAVEAQEVIFENWSKLNDLIGSADGKKFRQIAQEYTLDVLLSYANIHLELLTKRYVIQRISGSLALQVLDRDMGDEIRTVFSLSGGESFLVSLALALGLASLSSNRMKVESLFIDEGFGSLDPVTLNIAMDALEQLHNQGRKVGVISHVQEMTERITTQIKVRKLANGKSKISVAGL